MKTYLQISSIIFLLLFFIACNENSKPNQPPILVIAANPTSGVAPLAVSFTASAEDPDGVIASYSWNFGDGAGGSGEQNPTYTYNSPGTFTATCTVSDNGKPALTASATVVITVYQSKIPTLSSISPDWSVIHMPEFTLTATGTDFFPDSKIVFNDKVMATVYLSPTELTCEIMPDDTVLASALKSDGSLDLEANQYANVIVRNPGIGGGDSAALNFTIRPNHIFETPILVSPTSVGWPWYDDITLHRGKNLYVVYADPEYSSSIRVSKDLGQSWGNEHEMPDIGGYFKFPIAAGFDGILYLFMDEHLYKSSDDGQTWSDPILVSAGTPDEPCIAYWTDHPNIIRLTDGTLYTVWAESKNFICPDEPSFRTSWLLHSTSKDGGLTWSQAVKNPPHSDCDFYEPQLVKTVSGKIHLFFATGYDPQYPSGYHQMTSSDGGVSWSTPAEISSFTGLTYNSPVVGDDDGLYIPNRTVGASSQQIEVLYWLDGASTSGRTAPAVTLDLSQIVIYMSVSVDSAGNINLLYTRGPNLSSYAVYYQRSIDLGKTWTTPIRLSPLGCWAKRYPQICGAVGNLFVIWTSVNSPYPIYFTSSERNR